MRRTIWLGAVGALFALAAPPAWATTRYVSQSGGTFSGGSACNGQSAISVAAFNSTTNSAGDVDYLCGTITSAVTPQGSGSSGNVVTIKFDSGASIAMPALPTGGAIVLTGLSNYLVDGNSSITCGYVANANVTCNNGAIKSTANGTGLANQVASIGIQALNANNIEIRGLVIGPVYQHTSTSDTTQSPPGPLCVQFDGANNVSIHNNTLHDAGWCLNGGGGPSTNLNIYNNEIYSIDHGVGIGNANTSINIYSNHFHDMANWDTTNNSFHHDGIHLFGVTGAAINGANEYDNLFDGDMGNNVTAWIYNEGLDQNINMYNNVAYVAAGRNSCCGVIDFFGNGYTGSNNSAYNNVVLGAYTAGTGSCFEAAAQTSVTVKNNIFVGCQNIIGIDSATTIAAVNNNVYEDVGTDQGTGSAANTFSWHGSSFSSFTTWKSDCSCDSSGVFATLASINVNSSTGKPQTGSTAIGAGANLTSLGITALDSDILGTARPSSGAWDAGAYVYTSGGGGGGGSQPTSPSVILISERGDAPR